MKVVEIFISNRQLYFEIQVIPYTILYNPFQMNLLHFIIMSPIAKI